MDPKNWTIKVAPWDEEAERMFEKRREIELRIAKRIRAKEKRQARRAMATCLVLLLGLVAAPAAGQDNLWRAICAVESGGDPRAHNAREQAVGVAQIRPICVRDANRIVRSKRWSLADRYDPAKSRAIFEVYVGHYMKHYQLSGPEAAARIWNGGPQGWRRRGTLAYWRKVKARMEDQ